MMFFEKRKLIMFLNPLKKILREKYFKFNVLNRKHFHLFRNMDRLHLCYRILSISTSIALISRFYFHNENIELNIERIYSSEIEPLSSTSKNMIVLNIPKGTDINKHHFIKELIKQIKNRELNKLDIDIYYVEDDSSRENVYKANIYKRYGAIVSSVDFNDTSKDIENIKSFFIPKSEKSTNYDPQSAIKNVTYNSFEDDVINASNEKTPLLLMYYDDYCLMCFLLRPFMNSLAARVKNSLGIQFARYNIEKNDLHSFSPEISATPTFVLYRGKQKPEKWDEYKPKDLINKIIEIKNNEKENNCNPNELVELNRLEHDIFVRFQLFTVLNLWNLYIMDLQNVLINTPNDQHNKLSFTHIDNLLAISSSFLKDNIFSKNNARHNTLNLDKLTEYDKIVKSCNFQEIFLENIKKDMKRSDTMEENINYILNEIKGYCNDYLAIKGLIK